MIYAKDASDVDLTKYNVISSRIRLARNVDGVPFPKSGKVFGDRFIDIVKGAAVATEGLFDVDIYFMDSLSKDQKKVLVERHMISLPLANNIQSGVVIIEKGTNSRSIMLHEEDHIREQCVIDGFNLDEAFIKINEYDDRLLNTLNIAYDEELGFITACPTNLGTGMRASCQVFLPALNMVGLIDETLDKFKEKYAVTIRGIYGEGSEPLCFMYQISNTHTLGMSEKEIIESVKEAVCDICYLERLALERAFEMNPSKIIDKISRSRAILNGGAYSMTAEELADLIVDIKIGIISGVINEKIDIRLIDKLTQFVSPSTFEIMHPNSTEEEKNILRAKTVKDTFKGGTC